MPVDEVVAFARAHNSGDLVIRKSGEVVVDEVFDPAPDPLFVRTNGRQDVASVQKSFTSVLIGIAVANGQLQVTDTMRQYLRDGWADDLTIEHMLSMTSGLGPALEFVAKPGERWDYNLTVYPLLKRALTAATGESLEALTAKYITTPLGLADTSWQDRVWNDALPELLKPAFVYPDGKAMEALHSNARDLATFGEAVRTGSLPIDPGYAKAMVQPSQTLNPQYGWLWWVRGNGYAALGHGHQCCVIVPDEELVIARTGAPADDTFVDQLVRKALA
jgi:CubicO group peptidase (beta-lactamase class C family)